MPNSTAEQSFVGRRQRGTRASLMICLLTTVAACAAPAAAQTAQPAEQVTPLATPVDTSPTAEEANGGAQLEEIVVTASRYQETLQRTPLAVSALSANSLTQRGIVEVANLATEVPTLQIGTNGQNASVDISIRGITTNNVNTYSGNPAVAAYVNGVYVARTQGLNEGLFDIERVEILRGPQGTLYGRNATVGAINIITAKPTQEFDFRAEATIGNYGTVTTRGMLNVPITDNFAVRGVAFQNRNNGYQDTLGTTRENYFRADNFGGRLSAQWKPTGNLSMLLQVDGFRERGSPNLPVATPVRGTLNPSNSFGDPYHRAITPGREGIQNIDVFNVRANVDLELSDAFSLSYYGGYGEVDTFTFLDADGLPVDALTVNFDDRNWNTSHELLLRYANDRLKAVAGANYTAEGTSGDLSSDFPGGGGVAPRGLHFPHPDYDQDAFGVFGQATYSLFDDLRLTGGLRYSKTKASNPGAGTQFCNVGAPLNQPPVSPFCPRFSANNQRDRSFENVSWKAGFDYDVSDASLLFGSVSTGFKQGALNSESLLITTPVVRPEKVVNYELGIKNRLFNNTVTLNLAGFYMDYTDLQVSQVIYVTLNPPVTTSIVTNAAKARIYGAELEYAWQIDRNDQINGFASYLNAQYRSFLNAIDPVLDPASRNPLDLSGNRLIRSPEIMARINYSHKFDLNESGNLSPQVSFYYQSSSFLREFNQPFDRQPGYTRTDLRLTYNAPGDRLTVEGFIQNLENKAIRVAEYPVSLVLQSFYAPPRRYGIRIAYDF